MKRLFFILLLLFGYARAQNLPPYKPMLAGTINEWWIGWCLIPPDPPYSWYIKNNKYYADASKIDTIDGKAYQRFYYVNPYAPAPDTTHAAYVREDTILRAVYIRANKPGAQEGLLWDFNVGTSPKIVWIIETFCELPVVYANPAVKESEIQFVGYGQFLGEIYKQYSYDRYECIGNMGTGPFPPSCHCGSVELLSTLIYRKRDTTYLYKNDAYFNNFCMRLVGKEDIIKPQRALYYDAESQTLHFETNKLTKLNIYDGTGRLCYRSDVPAEQTELPLQNVEVKGLFIVQIETINGKTEFYKFFKN